MQKAESESRCAQVVEALTLATIASWVTYLIHERTTHENAKSESRLEDQRLMQTSHALVVLLVLGFAAFALSTFRPQVLSKAFGTSCRQERDAGLVVGCLLLPLALFSRLLVEVHHERYFSSFTYFYAWTSISIGVSILLKLAVFGTVTSLRVSTFVDVVLLPILFGVFSPIEAEWRFLLATCGRIIVATVLTVGLKLLPRSFTIGEGLLVAQGVGLCFYDLVLTTMSRVSECCCINPLPRAFHSWLIFDLERLDHVLALQVGVLGSLLVCAALIPLLKLYGSPSPTVVARPLPLKGSVAFVLTTAVVAGGVVYPWSGFLLQTWNPVAWLLDFLTESSSLLVFVPRRIALMGYWAVCLVVFVPLFAFISDHYALQKIVARKLFHLLVVVMLGPASLLDVSMLSLSYGVALGIFFLLECVRALAVPPFGQPLALFLRTFIDHREAGRVIMTHSYLLLGCALPLWLAPSSNTPSALVVNAGVLVLGIGDAMGAVVGSSIGKRKFFGSKTIEGSGAMFVSTMLASMPLHDYYLRSLVHGEHLQLMLLTGAILLVSVLEAATAQIDNLVLPLFVYIAFNLTAARDPEIPDPMTAATYFGHTDQVIIGH